MELAPNWEFVADTVMGGVSKGQLTRAQIDGRMATRLTGAVSLENDGGFVQMAFDLADEDAFDASGFGGLRLDVIGNGQRYDLRLRTTALRKPWQSFRTDFVAPQTWRTIELRFSDLEAHRTDAVFDPAGLRRIGILAIGSEMQADVAILSIALVT